MVRVFGYIILFSLAGAFSSYGQCAPYLRASSSNAQFSYAFSSSGMLHLSNAVPGYMVQVQQATTTNPLPDWSDYAIFEVGSTVSAIQVCVPLPPANMAYVPGGTFLMGNATNLLPVSEGAADELPQHAVSLSPFYMDSTEVAKGLWDQVNLYAWSNGYDCGAGGGVATGFPVDSVSWFDAAKWCNARSEIEGLEPVYYVDAGLTAVYKTGNVPPVAKWSACGYRLPTEAEWELAARGGANSKRFPWPDGNEIQHARANYWSSTNAVYDTSPTRGAHPGYTNASPVGEFPAHGYGLYDMAGNMAEWCWDYYDATYYGSSPSANPVGPLGPAATRVLRGGGYDDEAFFCRTAARYGEYAPAGVEQFIGFRAVRAFDCVSPAPPPAECFVSLNGLNLPPFTNWNMAATTIQAAVDAVQAGGNVWVAPGVYRLGASTNHTGVSRVSLTNQVSLLAASSFVDTWIEGVSEYPSSQVRCVYLGSNTFMSGFTLLNGSAKSETGWVARGGGAYMDMGSRMSDCYIHHNTAFEGGGLAGALTAEISNSIVEANSADDEGGGVLAVNSFWSVLQSNAAPSGAAVSSGNASYCVIRRNTGLSSIVTGNDEYRASTLLRNCLIAENAIEPDWNTALLRGELYVYNSTIANGVNGGAWWMGQGIGGGYNNLIQGGAGCDGCSFGNSLAASSPYTFLNISNQDYRLHPASPGIDAGDSSGMTSEELARGDLRGRTRKTGAEIDVGAFEFNGEADGAIPAAWLQAYQLPTNQTANFDDPDQDGYTTWQEYVASSDPTNPGVSLAISEVSYLFSNRVALTWPRYTNREYSVYRASAPAGPWQYTGSMISTGDAMELDVDPAQSHALIRIQAGIPFE